jgi:hypothetical protein
MVGQITRFHDPTSTDKKLETQESPTKQSLRDAYLGMTRQMYELEKTFTVSKLKAEIIVSPLAIYRESSLPNIKPEK